MHADALPRQSGPRDDGLGRAVAWAIGLHLLLAALLLISPLLNWREPPLAAGGAQAMEATLDASAADQRVVEQALRFQPEPLPEPVEKVAEEETVPPPQPLPEPTPQDAPVQRQAEAQERIPVPDDIDQEEASRDAISQEKARQEQEAKRRQEQIDLTERTRQQQAEQQRRLAAQQEETDRQQKLDEIRRKRAQAAREADLAEQKLRQLQAVRERSAATSSANASQYGGQSSATAGAASGPSQGDWVGAMVAAIERQWVRPPNVSAGQICPIRIRMLPGGEVMSAEVQPSCPYDEAARDSVERAVLKASPLPYAGFDKVAARDFVVRFQPSR